METNDLDKELTTLEAAKRMAKELRIPDGLVKPCVAKMFGESFQQGGVFNRDRVAYIIATEFRRMGIGKEEAEGRLSGWDNKNEPPLGRTKIRNKVRSAYRRDYTFGCNNEEAITEYCISRKSCPYYVENFKFKVVKHRQNRDFVKYGWPRKLTNLGTLVYYIGLVELERRRQVGAGGQIYASHKEIAKVCGCSDKYIGKTLKNLAKFGLILYKIGTSRRWERKASEIKRVIPIPKPRDI